MICAAAAVLLWLAMAPSAQAYPAPSGNLSFTPTGPLAGDTVTTDDADGVECNNIGSPNAPIFEFTYALENSDGSTTVTNSGDGDDSSLPVTYSAVVAQPGTYLVTEDAYCPNTSIPRTTTRTAPSRS